MKDWLHTFLIRGNISGKHWFSFGERRHIVFWILGFLLNKGNMFLECIQCILVTSPYITSNILSNIIPTWLKLKDLSSIIMSCDLITQILVVQVGRGGRISFRANFSCWPSLLSFMMIVILKLLRLGLQFSYTRVFHILFNNGWCRKEVTFYSHMLFIYDAIVL